MIKLIMSDMDGTLLDDDGRLPAEFDEVMDRLREKQVMFVPASGRQYNALVHQFEKYKDEFIFLAENGSYVSYQGREIFSSTMESALVTQLLAAVETIPGVYPVLCGKKSAYVKTSYRPLLAEMERYYTQYTFVDDFAAVSDDIIKLAVCDCDGQDAENTIYPQLSRFSGQLQVAVSSNYWVDVMNFGINKGVAVRKLQQQLGVSPQECAAFGDYLNDTEMMSAVHYSFAMENAHPQIKAAAKFQAKSNVENGVLLAIKELIDK